MAESILRTAYKGGPYRSSTIGSAEDIENLTIADAREFHQRYYVPGNMVGIIVGDVSITNAKKIIRRSSAVTTENPCGSASSLRSGSAEP